MSDPSTTLIYQQLLKNTEITSRVETKLDAITQTLNDHIAEDKKYYKRLEALEASKQRNKGFTAAIASVISVIVTFIGYYFSNK